MLSLRWSIQALWNNLADISHPTILLPRFHRGLIVRKTNVYLRYPEEKKSQIEKLSHC